MTVRAGGPGSAPPCRTVTDDEVQKHAGLVRMVVHRLYRQKKLSGEIEYDDAIQVGTLAVWEALRRYKPGKGAQSTYITSYIWGYVMKYQRDATKATGWHRTNGRIASVASLDEQVGPDGRTRLEMLADTAAPEDEALAHHALRSVVDGMEPRLRMVTRSLLADEPLATCADELGLSRERIRQLRIKALDVLRHEMAA